MCDLIRTRGQIQAELAYRAVKQRKDEADRKRQEDPTKTCKEDTEYRRVATSFPILLHSSGLAQAFAYAQGRGEAHEKVLADLVRVMRRTADAAVLADEVRSAPVAVYMKLSRDALQAASWIKRYAEALIEKDQ